MVAIAEQFPNIAFSKASGSLHYVLFKYYKEVSLFKPAVYWLSGWCVAGFLNSFSCGLLNL